LYQSGPSVILRATDLGTVGINERLKLYDDN